MTYKETLEGERIRMNACPQCGGEVSVYTEDDGWDDDLTYYVEYAVFECAKCGRTDRIRIVYAPSEWIMGWGHRED